MSGRAAARDQMTHPLGCLRQSMAALPREMLLLCLFYVPASPTAAFHWRGVFFAHTAEENVTRLRGRKSALPTGTYMCPSPAVPCMVCHSPRFEEGSCARVLCWLSSSSLMPENRQTSSRRGRMKKTRSPKQERHAVLLRALSSSPALRPEDSAPALLCSALLCCLLPRGVSPVQSRHPCPTAQNPRTGQDRTGQDRTGQDRTEGSRQTQRHTEREGQRDTQGQTDTAHDRPAR
jgi:hypothetical protein